MGGRAVGAHGQWRSGSSLVANADVLAAGLVAQVDMPFARRHGLPALIVIVSIRVYTYAITTAARLGQELVGVHCSYGVEIGANALNHELLVEAACLCKQQRTSAVGGIVGFDINIGVGAG